MRSYAWIVVGATLVSCSQAQAQGYPPPPSPYGNAGAYGYPWCAGQGSPLPMGPGMMPANMPYGLPPPMQVAPNPLLNGRTLSMPPGMQAPMPYGNGMPMGPGGMAPNMPYCTPMPMMPGNFKPYENPIPMGPEYTAPSMIHGNPMAAPSPFPQGARGEWPAPTCNPNGAAAGPYRLVSEQGPPTSRPLMLPESNACAADTVCVLPTSCMASESPCGPSGAPPDPRSPSAPLRPNPYTIDGDGRPWSLLSLFDPGPWPDALYHGWLLNFLWRANCEPGPDVPSRCWFDVEYLKWRLKKAPLSVPLVSGNNDPNAIGSLDEAGTTVLLGPGSNTDFGLFSGARFTAGRWFNKDGPFGMELSGFALETRSIRFDAGSNAGAAPIVSIPFNATQPFNFTNAGETSLNAGGAPNQVEFALRSRLWGAEANLIIDRLPSDYTGPLRMWAILGFRYLDLQENLTLNDIFFDTTTPGSVSVSDSFATRNQFFGGQIGARTSLNLGRWTVDASAKVAFGANYQVMNIAGATTVAVAPGGLAFGAFPPGVTPSGVFAEPSNIGRFSRNVFSVVPEGQMKVYYELTQSIRPFVGYNFLYMTNTVRAAGQIDRNVNPTQNSFFVPPLFPPTPPLAPLPLFHNSDFWAQGINVGLELRF